MKQFRFKFSSCYLTPSPTFMISSPVFETRVPGGLLIPVIYLLCVRKHCNRPDAWFNADISIYSQRAVAKQLGSSTEIDVGAVLYGTEHCPYHYTIFCHAQALGQTYDKEWLPLTPLKG